MLVEISPHGLRVAKGLLQAKMNRCPAARPIHQSCQPAIRETSADRYRDKERVFLDTVRTSRSCANYPAEHRHSHRRGPTARPAEAATVTAKGVTGPVELIS